MSLCTAGVFFWYSVGQIDMSCMETNRATLFVHSINVTKYKSAQKAKNLP